jgi:hydrophobe/amphiphile efflux-3 (HAE3) family protein
MFFPLLVGGVLALGMALIGFAPGHVVRNARAVLAVVLALTALSLVQLVGLESPYLKIRADSSSEPLLPVVDPLRDIYQKAVLSFGSDDIYVIAMETDGIFTAENLTALDRITDAIRALDGVRGVESLTNAYHFDYDPAMGWVEVGPFIEDVPTDPVPLRSLREDALADPLYAKTLISSDGRTAGLNVTFRAMSDGEFIARDLDGQIQAILALEAREGLRFHISGRPHIRAEGHHLMIRDVLRLIPIAVVVGLVVLWLITGSVWASVIPIGNCMVAMLWTLGALVSLGLEVNLITLVLGPMLLCVGGVYGVHVYGRWEAYLRETGEPQEAAKRCLAHSRAPVLMSGASTCAGFAALMIANIRATNEFSQFSILGVVAITILSLTLVPAALSLLPRPDSLDTSDPNSLRSTRFSHWMEAGIDRMLVRIARLTVRHPNRVLTLGLALGLASLAAMPRIVVDTDFLNFFLEDSTVRVDFASVNRLLTGSIPIYVVLRGESGSEGRFRDPELVSLVATLQDRLEKVPGVDRVTSMVDLIEAANDALHAGEPVVERIPSSRAELAEVIFTIPKEKLRRFATSNHGSINLVVRAHELGSDPLLRLERAIAAEIEAVGLPPDVHPQITGNAVLVNHSADRIANNQIAMIACAVVAVLLLVWGVLGSLELAVLSLVPNVLPVLLYFGALGLGAASLSLATSMVGCVALGIAVDDTMHLLVYYRKCRDAGASVEQAIADSLRGVGRAIVLTSLVLVACFLTLTTASFGTLREFGVLLAMTMGICLCNDLLLMPALLARFRV